MHAQCHAGLCISIIEYMALPSTENAELAVKLFIGFYKLKSVVNHTAIVQTLI